MQTKIFCIERDNLDTRFQGFGTFLYTIIKDNADNLWYTNQQLIKDKPYVFIHIDVLNHLGGMQQISEYFRLVIHNFCQNLAFNSFQFLLIQEQGSYVVQSTNNTPPQREETSECGSAAVSHSAGEPSSSGINQ